ncbi:hypothetical protein B0H10DRAFT_2222220 [Mycena sp. CBHHK59/15]|nr:hypothetical protein B0H10DRAFT_2222220 [Mycena sp. CBHHK59/15]
MSHVLARAPIGKMERNEYLKKYGLHDFKHFLWNFNNSDPYKATGYDCLHFFDGSIWEDGAGPEASTSGNGCPRRNRITPQDAAAKREQEKIEAIAGTKVKRPAAERYLYVPKSPKKPTMSKRYVAATSKR